MKDDKILNRSKIRRICHDNDLKISAEAMKELAKQTEATLAQVIKDTKEMGAKTILRRYVERRIGDE